MKLLTRTMLAASLMMSMSATDALANRGTSSRANAAQRQRTNANRAARVRTTRTRAPSRSQGQMSPQRTAEMIINKQYMEQAIQGQATPAFRLIPMSDATTMSYTRQGHYKNNITPAATVSGLGPSGLFNAMGLLPVSGHVQGQAEHFAKTNQYNIVVNGQAQPKVASTGYVTEKAFAFKLKPGKNIIQFWPDGSGGVGGFKAGREIEINWDGN